MNTNCAGNIAIAARAPGDGRGPLEFGPHDLVRREKSVRRVRRGWGGNSEKRILEGRA